MKNQKGAGMIEILISLVICAIGILGLIALQTNSGKSIQTTRYHEQANLALNELSSIIIANKSAASAFVVSNLSNGTDIYSPPSKNCTSVACTASEQAQYELFVWFSSVKTKIPSPRINIATTSENNGQKVTIQFLWDANLKQWIASVPAGDKCAAKSVDYPCIEYSLWVN